MQPVTMTLPFSASAAAMEASEFRLGAIEKTAGIDDHGVGARMILGEFVALRTQPRDDPLAVDQGFWTAE